MEPTLEQRYQRRIAQLEDENAALSKRVAELEAQAAELHKLVAKLTEQSIRQLVIGRWITQGSHSLRGRQGNGRIRTVLDTCRKSGRSAGQCLACLYFPTPTPSLLPQT